MKRKDFIKWGVGATGAVAAATIIGNQFLETCPVRILGVDAYNKDISKQIALAMKEDKLNLKNKSVLIKPNFVEFHKGHPINTNIELIKSIVEACLKSGAKKVTIGEAAGHRKDPFFSLHRGDLRRQFNADISLKDMNHGDITRVKNNGSFTNFSHFYVASPVISSDVVINVPKLKTHHWVGVTLSMKNLFGTLPGIYYGWPKNLLHISGIQNSILDLSVSIPVNYTIIDGIIGMEGDGPIMGTSKHVGAIIMSKHMLAADTTAAEIMGFNPQKIAYLSAASLLHSGFNKRGRIFEWEKPEKFNKQFVCLDRFNYIKS